MTVKYSANKILVIITRQIGDVLLVTPLLRSLRRAYPLAVIDVLVYNNKGGMLAGNPDYNHLITVAEHPNFSEYKILFKQIFRRYDLAISTLSGDRPLIYALFAASKRISIVPPKRWQDAWKKKVVHAWTELDNRNTHTVIQNLRLADLLGIARCYEFVVPQAIDSIVKIDNLLPFPWQKQAFAVVHLLPMRRYKRWTLQGWTQLVQYLVRTGLHIVLTGGDSDKETDYFRQALSNMPNTVISLAGQLRLSDVAQLIRSSTIYIGPDTAVTHLAAATGVPTIALYGPTNPLKWAPWPNNYALDKTPFEQKGTQKVGNVLLVQGDEACVPCHQEGCERHKQSDSRCLEKLDSALVIEAVKELLG